MASKVSVHTKLCYFFLFTLMMLMALEFFVGTHWIVAPTIYVFTLPLWIRWMCGSAFNHNPRRRFNSYAQPILYYSQQEETVRYVRGLQAALQPHAETVRPANVANDVLQNAGEICHCDCKTSVGNGMEDIETKTENQGLNFPSDGEKIGLAVGKDVLVGSSENLNEDNYAKDKKFSLDKVPLGFLYKLDK